MYLNDLLVTCHIVTHFIECLGYYMQGGIMEVIWKYLYGRIFANWGAVQVVGSTPYLMETA